MVFYSCDKQGHSDCSNAEIVGSPRQPKLGRGVRDLGADHAGARADLSLFSSTFLLKMISMMTLPILGRASQGGADQLSYYTRSLRVTMLQGAAGEGWTAHRP
jgi:hypothetical protein